MINNKTEQQLKDLTKRVQKLEHAVSQLFQYINVLRTENVKIRAQSQNIDHGLRSLSIKIKKEKE